ncbi:P-loop containing nucleoside triphosphate hydrolase protein [Mycena metata]|uniref:P-loop containing nucleoside triphosphate hydrolase protein n=1 Tax=Mycena metata TaxID=1033252 RepID=A0AAD7NUH7_9AGAR|nr:P-loop containing nucleoside triphosphate hydrolase protein [Mycena metata]
MRSALWISLLRLITRLGLASGGSWRHLLRVAMRFFHRLATHPQIAELFRFIFLGTIVETGRKVAEKIAGFATDLFAVKAEFPMGDFAYDWVVHYLEHHRVWNESRSFKVVARNAASRPSQSVKKLDGPLDHPIPIYEPATAQSPSLFRWRGYWMSISKTTAGLSHYDTHATGPGEGAGALVIAVWSRRRDILDEFVSAARNFYVTSEALPREQLDAKREASGALLTAHFEQSDLAHDWMLQYLRSSDALCDIMDYHISMKQSDLGWGTGPRDAVRFMPAPDSMQRFLFKSPRTGRSTWVQVLIHTGIESWDSNRMIGGSIRLTLHSSDKEVLADLIECAKQKYIDHGTSRVTVHLASAAGSWAKTVIKSRRALSTLILPADTKETILADAREFLASAKWYNMAGIPHRRGYLLYGAPGTGKSSTIHAIAGELGLEIYFISLASPGINDYSLAHLISDTPSRCILLMEDIDCAFPSREEVEEEDEDDHQDGRPKNDQYGNPIRRGNMMPPKSAVTLSGLLNVLDSVSSEEGRITFATTNHIANLDPALIRPGRMDVKIKYGLATTDQIEQVFKVFFPALSPDDDSPDDESAPLPSYTTEDLERYSTEFAAIIPNEVYSIAQIQGYFLTKKHDPLGAVHGAADWLVAQKLERRAMLDAKKRMREEFTRWQRGMDELYRGGGSLDAWERVVGDGEHGEASADVGTPTAVPYASSGGSIVDLLVGPSVEFNQNQPL